MSEYDRDMALAFKIGCGAGCVIASIAWAFAVIVGMLIR
jgi:hypothetical protein